MEDKEFRQKVVKFVNKNYNVLNDKDKAQSSDIDPKSYEGFMEALCRLKLELEYDQEEDLD